MDFVTLEVKFKTSDEPDLFYISSHGDIFERKQIALDLVREIKEHMNEGAFYEFITHNGDEEEPLVVFSVLQTKEINYFKVY